MKLEVNSWCRHKKSEEILFKEREARLWQNDYTNWHRNWPKGETLDDLRKRRDRPTFEEYFNKKLINMLEQWYGPS